MPCSRPCRKVRAQARSSLDAWPLCSDHHSLWPPAGAALNPDPDDGTGDGDEGTLLHSTLALSLALSLALTLILTLTLTLTLTLALALTLTLTPTLAPSR